MTKKTKSEFNELVRDDSRYGDKPKKKHGLTPYKRAKSQSNSYDINGEDDDYEDDAPMYTGAPAE